MIAGMRAAGKGERMTRRMSIQLPGKSVAGECRSKWIAKTKRKAPAVAD